VPDLERRNDEIQRLWTHVRAAEKDIETVEKLVSGMHYALFGLPEVPGSGLVNTIDNVRRELHGVRRGIVGLIGTGAMAITVQIILHYT
jgi:isochorismate synthase EntC